MSHNQEQPQAAFAGGLAPGVMPQSGAGPGAGAAPARDGPIMRSRLGRIFAASREIRCKLQASRENALGVSPPKEEPSPAPGGADTPYAALLLEEIDRELERLLSEVEAVIEWF